MNTAALQKAQPDLPATPLPALSLNLSRGKALGPARAPAGSRPAENPLEVQVASLKLLASTLLRQIDSLQEQVLANAPAELDLQTEVRRFEAELIRNALIRTKGKQRRAARLLGMKVTTLNTKIKRYKITIPGSSDDTIVSAGLLDSPH